MQVQILAILITTSVQSERLAEKAHQAIDHLKFNWFEGYQELQFLMREIKDAFVRPIEIWQTFVINRHFILSTYYSTIIFSILFVQINNGGLGKFEG